MISLCLAAESFLFSASIYDYHGTQSSLIPGASDCDQDGCNSVGESTRDCTCSPNKLLMART
jgi:hypothetical protein